MEFKDQINFLDDSIPEVRKQLLRCCFGCEHAKAVDMPESRCAGRCLYGEQLEQDYRKRMESES